ncbi:RBR-type E3 ubiquitin transferase [Sarracenia purpurea var. burkii]
MDSEELHTILSEQRREFAVAKTVESDLDLAFQLQMQEVMNASASASALIQQSPSSSFSSSTRPPFQLQDDDVFEPYAFGANMDSEELHTILSEQRRELAAPKSVESDLDLPVQFQLQLQEVMNASASALIQQSPSSSFSSSTSPPFQLRDDDVFGPYEFDASMDSEELPTILSEQRRELAAAKTVESDLDLAFQLQMQEAMNASTLIQQSPSSSFSSSTPPPFQLGDDDVSGPSFATVLDEEIARFERERADREQSEAERRLMRDDLSRWIHDQAFALEMSRIAEEEWQKTGNHFNRPYVEGSSSSAAIPNPEFFQLYFKGLVREETVKGAKKTLAGIGIAVCDTRQHRIFELRKALLGGGEMCAQVAEIEALIEGLNCAVILGVKRITFFCGDNALYEYVSHSSLNITQLFLDVHACM